MGATLIHGPSRAVSMAVSCPGSAAREDPRPPDLPRSVGRARLPPSRDDVPDQASELRPGTGGGGKEAGTEGNHGNRGRMGTVGGARWFVS